MKRVLMIAYYFPPIGGPGVYRSLKFCKYLPGCGWQPVIVSGDRNDPDFEPDDTLARDIPASVEVHRIPFPHDTMWRRTRAWLFSHHLGRIGHHLGFFFDFPCRFREWSRSAVKTAERVVQQHRPDVVLTSAPPFSAFLAGAEIKWRCGIPWVADFRDPWIGNPILLKGFPRWQLARHQRAEASVARLADACVFAHPIAAREFAARYQLEPYRAHTITNGFDPRDFAGADGGSQPGERLTVVHTGSFYSEYSPAPLLRALEQASSSRLDLPRQLRLVFVGGCTEDFGRIPGLEVEVHPRLPHHEAIGWMKQADVLLTVLPRVMKNYCIPGKLYDYMAARRPILAIVPAQGSCAEIVCTTRTGLVADPDQPAEIIRSLEQLVAWKQGAKASVERDEAEIQRFSLPVLTKQLGELLDDACVRQGRGRAS